MSGIEPSIGVFILLAMNKRCKHVYAGTVSYDERLRRRKRNRAARKARRHNR